MRFVLSDARDFEIPDDWWAEAGMNSFQPRSQHYAYKPDPRHDANTPISIIPIALIKPLHRNPGVEKDFGGFERKRLMDVLTAFATGLPIPPIEIRLDPQTPYEYSLYDGYHRFRASVAAGFTHVPAIIIAWW